MSGKRKSQKAEEPAKKPKLEAENSTKILNTKDIPDPVWQKIFGFLSLEEIKLKVARVCKHFYEISNDCVKVITIDKNILASDNIYEMFDALPTFKYLKVIKIDNDVEEGCCFLKDVEFLAIQALKNCPRLRFLQIMKHELSIGFMKHIVKHGQDLCGLELDFVNTNSDILSPLVANMKNLKHLGLYHLNQSDYKTEDLLALVKNCKDLNSLLLHGCEIPEDLIHKLINSKKEKLKKFHFDKANFGDAWLQLLIYF